MVDEADRMSLRCLNVLRIEQGGCKVPVLLVGEEILARNLGRERRLISRVRSMVNFEPVSQADVVVFFKSAMGQALTPAQAAKLLKHSEGDFRKVLTSAVQADRIMTASGIKTITDKIIDEICKTDK